MVRPVLRYPDPVLKRACEPVSLERGLALAEDLVDTMRAHPGCVGLAAPQVGEPLRVAVVDVSGHRLATSCGGLVVLVNPTLVESAGLKIAREGCLSLPAITADVARAKRVLVGAAGRADPLWAEGFEARAIQHELDHLDGILILDRVAGVHAIFKRQAAG